MVFSFSGEQSRLWRSRQPRSRAGMPLWNDERTLERLGLSPRISLSLLPLSHPTSARSQSPSVYIGLLQQAHTHTFNKHTARPELWEPTPAMEMLAVKYKSGEPLELSRCTLSRRPCMRTCPIKVTFWSVEVVER